MKKSFLTTLVLSTSLFFGTATFPSITVNASNWHKGMPKKLRGTWNSKKLRLIITNKHVYLFQKNKVAAVSNVKKIQYRYLGNRKYTYKQYFVGGGNYTGNLKLSPSGHYAKMSGVPGQFHKK